MAAAERTPEAWATIDPGSFQRRLRRMVTRPGRWWYRVRNVGSVPRVPEEGGFLVAPGPHGSYADPLLIGFGQRRTLRFMAKHQVFGWPLLGRLIGRAGGFPVYRGRGDRGADAITVARAVVESGDGVVIFMEGRLELDHVGLGTPRDGLARLALATGAPVVPVGMSGTKRARVYGSRWWRHRPRVTLAWGEPLCFEREDAPTAERIAQVREAIWSAVGECFDHARAVDAERTGRGELELVGEGDVADLAAMPATSTVDGGRS